jgi:hypothetical protein
MNYFEKQELIRKSQQEYSEFVNMVDGMPFNEIGNFVKENNLTYGMYEPKDGEGVVDINYKHLLVTVGDSEGVCSTNLVCEIYDDDGNLVEVCDNPYGELTNEEKYQLGIEQLLG